MSSLCHHREGGSDQKCHLTLREKWDGERRKRRRRSRRKRRNDFIPLERDSSCSQFNSIAHFVRVLPCFLTRKCALLSKTACDDVTFQTNSPSAAGPVIRIKGRRGSDRRLSKEGLLMWPDAGQTDPPSFFPSFLPQSPTPSDAREKAQEQSVRQSASLSLTCVFFNRFRFDLSLPPSLARLYSLP